MLPNRPVLAVLGPTASGKTGLAIKLAEQFGAEIINCDSRQIYREMLIGTAYPTQAEMARVAHHLFGIIAPDESFNAAAYMQAAVKTIKNLWQRRRLPLLVGGTGFYYEALSQGLGSAGHDLKLAQRLRAELAELGTEQMHERLRRLDPQAAAQISASNSRRVLRAIEIITLSGRPLAENQRQPPMPEANFLPLVVSRPRDQLHVAIAQRVDKMFADGLKDEVSRLVERYGYQAAGLNSIGYHEWFDFFRGDISEEQVREAIVIHTRQYAKRQETWLRRRPGPPIYNLSEQSQTEQMFNNVAEFIKVNAL